MKKFLLIHFYPEVLATDITESYRKTYTGERITKRELAVMAHGGLCLNCDECRYPVCPFGK